MTDELSVRLQEAETRIEDLEIEVGSLTTELADRNADLEALSVQFTPNVGDDEPPFRERVRDLLDLDWSARDERIFDELRRLKGAGCPA